MTDENFDALLSAKLVGQSAKMQQLRMLVKFAGRCSSSIMITGPSGSGKEVVADAIHSISQKASGPNITVNCGAIPDQLIESELFGHEKGSFTGAIDRRIGLFEQSDGGTIFLDEIGDMPLNMQVKLLRVLETRIVNRIGGNRDIPVNVRVIAATHKNLGTAIQEKDFREDLFYRLCVVPIEVPALHERLEDIPDLIEHFLKQQDRSDTQPVFTAEALAELQNYSWPGNVRELRNVVERAAVFFSGHEVLAHDIAMLLQAGITPATARDTAEPVLAQKVAALTPPAESLSGAPSRTGAGPQQCKIIDLNIHLQSEERRIILHALESAHGVVSRAARSINIKRTTFIDKMRKHDIEWQEPEVLPLEMMV